MIKIIFIISKSFIICLIQEDIEMVVKDGKHKLVGFVDLGEMHDAFEKFSGTVIIEINNNYLVLFIIVLSHWSGALTDCHNSRSYGIKFLIFNNS